MNATSQLAVEKMSEATTDDKLVNLDITVHTRAHFMVHFQR